MRGEEKDEESEGADRRNRTSMASRDIPRITTPPMAIPYFACRYSWLLIYFYIANTQICTCMLCVSASFYCVNVDYLL